MSSSHWFTQLCNAGALLATGLAAYKGYELMQHMLADNKSDKYNRGAAKKQAILQRLQSRYGPTTTINDLQLDEYETALLDDVIFPSELNTSFADVGGLNEQIDEIRESIMFPLTYAALLQQSHAQTAAQSITNAQSNTHPPSASSHSKRLLHTLPKGVLFMGPSGTGKTTVAKAIAVEAAATFIQFKVSSIESKWYGESNKNIAALFSIAPHGESHDASVRLKGELLSNWDGLTTNDSPVIVLACTNRPEQIDPAVQRRLPRTFLFDLPDLKQRQEILTVLLQQEALTADVNLAQVAAATADYSGSDLKELCLYAAKCPLQDLSRTVLQYQQQQAAAGTPLQTHQLPPHLLQTRPISAADFAEALRKIKPTGQASIEYAMRYRAQHHGNHHCSSRHQQEQDDSDYSDATDDYKQPLDVDVD